MRFLAALALFLSAAPALAQPQTRTVEVHLSNFDFTPREIRLRAGEPIVLRLVNDGGGGHDFAAPDFFAAAREVSGPVTDGKVEVAGRQSAEIRLTPVAGNYRLRCTHTLHASFGMTGQIVVE